MMISSVQELHLGATQFYVKCLRHIWIAAPAASTTRNVELPSRVSARTSARGRAVAATCESAGIHEDPSSFDVH